MVENKNNEIIKQVDELTNFADSMSANDALFMEFADQALYQAKEKGRNQTEVYEY